MSYPRCTLAYAAPEVALAANANRKIEMTADQVRCKLKSHCNLKSHLSVLKASVLSSARKMLCSRHLCKCHSRPVSVRPYPRILLYQGLFCACRLCARHSCFHIHISAHAAQDIWALGVMAFEAVTRQLTLNTMKEMYDCASGRQCYPCASDSVMFFFLFCVMFFFPVLFQNRKRCRFSFLV